MVEFVSLFLGLVAGVQPVDIAVETPVASIELRLDGEIVDVVEGEPWSLACDFGDALAPHELTVIGRDREGREISRDTQWINLPRPRIQVRLIPERSAAGPARKAHLLWRTVGDIEPDAVSVSFDGVELELEDPHLIELPDYDPKIPHLIEAELVFANTVARAETTVGGSLEESVETELSMVPVIYEGTGKPPAAADMAGWLTKKGEILEIVAVEASPADIFFVQDQSKRLRGQLLKMQRQALGLDLPGLNRGVRSSPAELKHRDRLRAILPLEVQAGGQMDLFPMSENLAVVKKAPTTMGVGRTEVAEARPAGLLMAIPYPAVDFEVERQRLTDAVAVAGLYAAEGRRARAVVLLLGKNARDQSRNTPASVRSYLRDLRVPFVVWSTEPAKASDAWGQVVDISTRNKFMRSMRDLRGVLERQLMVWVEGRHLPQQIEVSPAARDLLSLAGTSDRLLPDAISTPEPEAPEPAPELVAEAESEARPEPVPGTTVPGTEVPGTEVQVPGTEVPGTAVAVTTRVAEPAPADFGIAFDDIVDVNVVNLEVVVTDKSGRRLRDLGRDDFRIFEDGKPVAISHFVAPAAPEPVPVPAAESDVDGVPLGGSKGGKDGVPSGGKDSVDTPPLHLVVFIDATHIDISYRKKVTDALGEVFAAEEVPAKVMLVTYDRRTRIRQGFTDDPRRVEASLQEIQRRFGARSSAFLQHRSLIRDIARLHGDFREAVREFNSTGSTSALSAASAQQMSLLTQVETRGEETRREIGDVLNVLGQFVLSLGGVEGRKALLYVGDRLGLTPAADLLQAARTLDFDAQGVTGGARGMQSGRNAVLKLEAVFESLNLYRDFERLTREANANGVTFYTLTPPIADNTMMEVPIAVGGDRPVRFAGAIDSERLDSTKEAACLMSNATGGLCQVGGTKLELLLDLAVDDFESFYSLAYVPERDPDGEFHKIEVKVERPRVRVRHREGYVDKTRAERLADQLNAALLFDAEVNDLDMEIRIEEQQSTAEKGLRLVPFEVKVPVKRLAALPIPGSGKSGVKAKLLVVAMDPRGRTLGVQEVPISFQVENERLSAPPPLVYAHKVHLKLAPGDQKVAIGLWDEIGQTGAFLSRAVTVEDDPPVALDPG